MFPIRRLAATGAGLWHAHVLLVGASARLGTAPEVDVAPASAMASPHGADATHPKLCKLWQACV